MIKKFYVGIASMLFMALGAGAQTRQTSTLLEETFETSSTTIADWGVSTANCTGVNWQFYSATGAAANGTDRFVGFPSSSASSGCSQILYAPTVTIERKTDDDSIKISFWVYRTSTSSTDHIDLYLTDATSILQGPARIYQYNLQAPATGTGWQKLFWNWSLDQLTTGDDLELTFAMNAVAASGEDLAIDEVKIEQVWYSRELHVSTPGDSIPAGKRSYTSWMYGSNDNDMSPTKVEYSLNGGTSWSTIITSNGTFISYPWDVPYVETNNALIRVTNVADPSLTATSDTFTIYWPIELTSHNSGETLGIGTKETITWDASQINRVNIDYSTDGGTNWMTVEQSLDAFPASYEWTVPNTPSTDVYIRVYDASDDNLFDKSAKAMTIAMAIKLTSPNGGETVGAGSSFPIKWQSISKINKVKIAFTANGGVQWNEVATNVDASLGTYSWTVPNTPSATVKIRIEDMDNNTILDESDAYFTIYDASSIREVNGERAFTCFPNPSTGSFAIRTSRQLTEPTQVIITDLAGRTVYTAPAKAGVSEIAVDISNLNAGIYNVMLVNEKQTIRQQIVVK